MEPHPIPQNITTFQFKLVGDMTLKQFIYLASGAGLAYLLFVFLAAKYPFFAWPLIIISASLGAAFAFLPYQSRPLDYWVYAFFKAIYSPTQRIWQKTGKNYKEDTLFQSRYITYLSSLQSLEDKLEQVSRQPVTIIPVAQPITKPKPVPIMQTSPTPVAPEKPVKTTSPVTQVPQAKLPTPEELEKTVNLAKQAQTLQVRIIQTERALNQIRAGVGQPGLQPEVYTEQVNRILSDLHQLTAQASAIRAQLDSLTKPTQLERGPQLQQRKVKVVIPVKPRQTQIALTTLPNVINGIIKDTKANYLEGVVAVIYDKEGLPVRALKTNKLGQFTGSTPLPNGTYNLEFEKEGFTFDILQIELSGGVLPPLFITNK